MKFPFFSFLALGDRRPQLSPVLLFRKLCRTGLVLCLGSLTFSASAQPASEQVLSSLMLDVERAGESGRLVAVGDRGYVLWSDDMGKQWQQARVPEEVMLTSVHFPVEKTGYAVGHDASIFKTVDGGQTWVSVYRDKEAEIPLLDVFFISQNVGFVMGAYGYFMKTGDGGKTWNDWAGKAENEEELHLNAMTRLDNGTLVIAGEAGLLMRSVNNGEFWEKLDAPYEGSFFGVQSLAQNSAAVAFGLRGNAYVTHDSGLSWKALETGTEQTLFDGVVLGDNFPLMVGTGGALALKSGEDSLVSNLKDRATLTGIIQARDNSYVITSENGVRRVGPDVLGQQYSSR